MVHEDLCCKAILVFLILHEHFLANSSVLGPKPQPAPTRRHHEAIMVAPPNVLDTKGISIGTTDDDEQDFCSVSPLQENW
jgi:hypothetical protein